MKLYSLVNMYCSGVHAGIQTQHATVRLLRKYHSETDNSHYLISAVEEWADRHETTVVLNGGDHYSLMEWTTQLGYWDNVPFAEFREPGLNNALTSVVLVCSTEMVDDMAKIRAKEITEEELIHKYYSLGAEILTKLAYMRTI